MIYHYFRRKSSQYALYNWFLFCRQLQCFSACIICFFKWRQCFHIQTSQRLSGTSPPISCQFYGENYYNQRFVNKFIQFFSCLIMSVIVVFLQTFLFLAKLFPFDTQWIKIYVIIILSFSFYSEAVSSQVPNKFNNDGSFLEQFKKMSKNKSGKTSSFLFIFVLLLLFFFVSAEAFFTH